MAAMRTSTPPAEQSRAVGYLRCSTSEQADSRLGLDAQGGAVKAFCLTTGSALAGIFVDAGVSGALPLEKRPGLLAALDAIKAGDTLVVARRDRLGRDLLNVAMIERLVERAGARVASAAGEGTNDDGPTGVLMRQIIDAFAQFERAIIASRTRAALAARRAKGGRVGRPRETPEWILRRVVRARRRGTSWAAIAARLDRDGVPTVRGAAKWRPSTVQRIAESAEYERTLERAAAGGQRA